jgi:uncharacterized repeat protein (TIGR01451 family)
VVRWLSFKPLRAGAIILPLLFFPPTAETGRVFSSTSSAASPIFFSASAPLIRGQSASNSPASISYTFKVDKLRPGVNDSLIYTLTIWNDPLQSDTLREVEVEFNLPRLENGNFALQLQSFRYAGPHPFTLDSAQGRIVWRLGRVIRHTPPLPVDTARVVFSLRIAEVSNFSLTCGENPITAFARVSFVDENGRRIFPGTPRAAESTLFLTPDFVAERVTINPTQVQSGEIITLEYFFRNDGNIGRRVDFCFRFPPGLDSGLLMGVSPDSIGIPTVLTDSLCLKLGFVPAASARSFQLRILAIAPSVPPLDLLCFNGQLDTDCDLRPENNFFPRACATLAPLDLLAVQKRGDRTRMRVGDTLRYTIDFSNVAILAPAWNVALTDTVPAGMEFISATSPHGFANGVLTWQRPQMPAGTRDSVSFIVRLRQDFFVNIAAGQACLGANIRNAATIASTAADGSPSPESPAQLHNNRATYTAFVEPLDDLLEIQLNVSAVPPATLANLAPGDTLRYELSYFNRSDLLPATSISLFDTLPDPAYVQLLETPPGFVYDAANNLLRRENFTLAPLAGQSISYRMLLRRDAPLCVRATLNTRAAIFEMSGQDCQSNNRAGNALVFEARTNLLALSVQTSGAVLPGEEIEIFLQASNESDLVADSLTITNISPAAFEIVLINDGGVRSGPNQIHWSVGALPARQSRSVSFRARASDSVFCAAATAANFAWLSSLSSDCMTADDTARTAITILPTPPEQQPRLLATTVRTSDQNGDGCAEPGERVVARITVVNRNNLNLVAQEIAFLNPCATVAGACATMAPISLSPQTIAPGDSAVATFEFVIRENDFSAQTILLSFTLAARGFCPQAVVALPVTDTRYCPQPEVALRVVDLNDANGNNDGFASEIEPLNLIVIAENTGPLLADSVDLFVTLAPVNFSVLQSNKAIPASMPMHWRSMLLPGARDSLILQFQYQNFFPQDAVVAASAYLQVSAIAGPQAPQTDHLEIQKDCYARPNPFIPTRHSGVRFAPNDGQRVEIFDLQGTLIRALVSPGPWDGRDERGRLCDPGFYVWKIEDACQGSIVVVR